MQKQIQETKQKETQESRSKMPTVVELYVEEDPIDSEEFTPDDLEEEVEFDDEDNSFTKNQVYYTIDPALYRPRIKRAGFILKTEKGYRLYRVKFGTKSRYYANSQGRRIALTKILDTIEEWIKNFEGDLDALKQSVKSMRLPMDKKDIRSELKEYYLEFPDGEKLMLFELTPSGRPKK